MDLKSLLEKNKQKAEKYSSHIIQPKTSIATHDRPYVIDFQENDEKKTGNKQVTNGKQTGNKQVTTQEQIGKQLVNKQVTKKSLLQQTGNKQVTKRVTELAINGKQTGNKQVTKETTTQIMGCILSTLVGIQRKIIIFFYFLTKKSTSQSTKELTLEHISNSLKTKKSVIKTTIIRLQKKGYLFRKIAKTGRGGWTIYELPNTLYKELMQQDNFGYLDDETGNKQVTINDETGNKQVTKRVTEQVTSPLSSSSYNIIKTTTTELKEKLSVEWQKIDCEVLSWIGFDETHLIQLQDQGNLSPELVQDSIYHFAFDLNHNNKQSSIKGDAINFFMGILSRGRSYARPLHYISPQEESLNAYHAEKEQERKRIEALEQKTQEPAFQSWYSSLSDEALEQMLPDNLKDSDSSIRESVKQTLRMQHLKKHFTAVVWPETLRKLSLSPKQATAEIPELVNEHATF